MRITSVIDNLDEKTAGQLIKAAQLGRTRFEVQLDRVDGDGEDMTFHFRLVELTATQGPAPDDVVTEFRHGKPEYRTKDGRLLSDDELAWLAAYERAAYPKRMITVGGLGGSYPVMEMPVAQPSAVNPHRLAQLVGQLVRLGVFDARAIGLTKSDGESIEQAAEKWLRGDDTR
jgi:hypothetical protein